MTCCIAALVSISIGSLVYAGYVSKNYILKQQAAKTRQKSNVYHPFKRPPLAQQEIVTTQQAPVKQETQEPEKIKHSSSQKQSIDMGTQTETADPKILFMLDGVLEQYGDMLFYYAQVIDDQKKKPALRLILQTYARRAYIALNTIITDAATLEAIHQTNDLDAISKQAIKDSQELVQHVADLMVALAEPNSVEKQNSLKSRAQSAVEKLLKENSRTIESNIEEQLNKTIEIIQSLQLKLEQEESVLEKEIASLSNT